MAEGGFQKLHPIPARRGMKHNLPRATLPLNHPSALTSNTKRKPMMLCPEGTSSGERSSSTLRSTRLWCSFLVAASYSATWSEAKSALSARWPRKRLAEPLVDHKRTLLIYFVGTKLTHSDVALDYVMWVRVFFILSVTIIKSK